MSLEGKTEDQIRALEQQLLKEVELSGGVAGNVSLVRSLKWDEDLYWSVRDRLGNLNSGGEEVGASEGFRLTVLNPQAFQL